MAHSGAQKYPDEVSAIIGLDMAVPEYYDSMNINIPLMRAAGCAAHIGITFTDYFVLIIVNIMGAIQFDIFPAFNL